MTEKKTRKEYAYRTSNSLVHNFFVYESPFRDLPFLPVINRARLPSASLAPFPFSTFRSTETRARLLPLLKVLNKIGIVKRLIII